MRWFAFLFELPFLLLLLAGGLLLNRPPLLSLPGPMARLVTYLTTNVAETRQGHAFPELHPPLLSADAREAQEAVMTAMNSMGWREVEATEEGVRAIVVSPIFRFRDDVTVRPEATEGGALLHARSASRVGKGDLAANERHLLTLFAEIERLLSGEDAR